MVTASVLAILFTRVPPLPPNKVSISGQHSLFPSWVPTQLYQRHQNPGISQAPAKLQLELIPFINCLLLFHTL